MNLCNCIECVAGVAPGQDYCDECGPGSGCPDCDDEMLVCCRDAAVTGESHYHCGNCGEVSSMMGHYDPLTSKFTCKPKTDAAVASGPAA